MPLDERSIDALCAPERRYWMKELGCTEVQLLLAVCEAGPRVVDVKRYLATLASPA
jgi:hypothetical protein